MKKVIYLLVTIFLIFISIELTAVAINKWYFEKIAVAQTKKHNFDPDAANAIKHAYAASLVHGFFRNLWLGKRASRGLTIFLGEVNEVAELMFRPTKDSTLEIMKDMHNNMVGIYVSELLETRQDKLKKRERLDIINDLMANDILLISGEKIPLSDSERAYARRTSEFSMARKWFVLNKNNIVKKTDKFLLGY